MASATAFLFPGQGQLPTDVLALAPKLDGLYQRAEEEGLLLRDWIRSGQGERLSQTDAAQPAVFLDSLARGEILESGGRVPDVVAGHSLGDYTALVVAGVLSAEAALSLVIRRGRLMAEVRGGMTAVLRLDHAAVAKLCADVGRGATIANQNGETQFVVSGSVDVLDDIERAAVAHGGRAIRLAVSGPFHSPAMEPAQSALQGAIAGTPFSPPHCAFVSSVTGQLEEDPGVLKALLARQMTAPVLWTNVIRTLAALGVTEAMEVGAGNVLTQLGRRAETRVQFRSFEEVSHA